ncbi:hypothetical protein [Carboxydothermus hydrogenoformans]|uniref:Uncharacterized protein n=1 Tax=Carboxydothermus hydrogenoformans (strain ATCC BAA-161 / DSM 6008 / Z-2901) TaxID=246194 RepID=Q3AD72_CARHZ|nr:hypothetical protein [Carboxydothermus hydrogenoformans]ABB14232.1 hypothetical protein CHY_1066 [Carboxydothermus hydrogenoformans Z-2901]
MVFLVNRKLLYIAVTLIIFIFGIKIYFANDNYPDLIKKAVLEVENLSSYRYTSEVRIMEREKVEYLSRVEGVKTGEGTWVKGEILETPVEILCIDNTTYFRDSQTGRWLTFPGIKLEEAEALVNELNPLRVLAFNRVENVRFRGTEKIDGEKCLVLEGRPDYQHPILKHLYYDYEGKFYLAKKDKKLKRVVLRAKSRFNKTVILAVRITFREAGKEVKLPAPG